MQHSAAGAIAAAASRHDYDDEDDDGEEKIGIARIKLRQSHLGLTAVLSGFFEAERLLTAWNANADVPVECEFEVIFTDAHAIRGRYKLARRWRGRPALRSFIVATLCMRSQGVTMTAKRARKAIFDEFGNIVDRTLLRYYEIESGPRSALALRTAGD